MARSIFIQCSEAHAIEDRSTNDSGLRAGGMPLEAIRPRHLKI